MHLDCKQQRGTAVHRAPVAAVCRRLPPTRAALWVLAAFALLLPTARGAAAAEADVAAPLVIIGGALEPDNEAVYRAILDRRLDDGAVCVVPTASGQPKRSMRSYVDDFRRYAGSRDASRGVLLRHDRPRRADASRWAARLADCGAFFFTGGDQSRIVDVWRPRGRSSQVDAALRARHAAGAPVAGTSAGAAMMSDPMIGAGGNVEALRHGVVDRDGPPGVWVRDGMGFWPGVLVDQHFLERDRLGRLLVALAASSDASIGVGIDEDTALVVDPDAPWRVVGRSGVVIVARTSAAGAPFTGHLWLLAPGDGFDLQGMRAEAAGAQPVTPSAAAARAADLDPWTDGQLRTALRALAADPGRAQIWPTPDGGSVRLTPSTTTRVRPAAAEDDGGSFLGPIAIAVVPASAPVP
ncbi:MAG: cyanophycinase, partial [Acidobacteriota bacterium]